MNRAAMYLWNGRMMFFGITTHASMHRHHAMLVAIGLSSAFSLKHNDGRHECRLAVVNADEPHQFDSDAPHVLLLIEPETETGKHIKQALLGDCKVKALDIGAIEAFLPGLNTCMVQEYPCQRAKDLSDDVITAISGERERTRDVDSRIRKALEILSRSPEKKMPAKSLADLVYLSEGRLTHLFKEQVGIPIRHYLLWLRLMEALNLALEGKAITTAAHDAGFADSAHLSRVFRRMFGMKLSEISKNSRFVQVIICQQFYT